MARDMRAGAVKSRRRRRPSRQPAPPPTPSVSEVMGPDAHIGPHLHLHLLRRGI